MRVFWDRKNSSSALAWTDQKELICKTITGIITSLLLGVRVCDGLSVSPRGHQTVGPTGLIKCLQPHYWLPEKRKRADADESVEGEVRGKQIRGQN